MVIKGKKSCEQRNKKKCRSQTSSQVSVTRCPERADGQLRSLEGNDGEGVYVPGSCLSCLTDSCTARQGKKNPRNSMETANGELKQHKHVSSCLVLRRQNLKLTPAKLEGLGYCLGLSTDIPEGPRLTSKNCIS